MTFTYNDCDLETKRQIDAINAEIKNLVADIESLKEGIKDDPSETKSTIAQINSIRGHITGLQWKILQLLHNSCPRHAWRWSGYYLDAKTYDVNGFNMVSGEWQVPSIETSVEKLISQSAAWIGISADINSEEGILQTGTSSAEYEGIRYYWAWFQAYPLPFTNLTLPVSPGDIMRAFIRELRKDRWQITLRNRTQNWGYTTIIPYKGPKSFAEFIVERAPVIPGIPENLAEFEPVTFNNCRVNSKNPMFKTSQSVAMIPHPDQNPKQLATPSDPSSDGDGFTVAYGNQKPPRPIP